LLNAHIYASFTTNYKLLPVLYNKPNKKSELTLMRCARAYSSFCSQVNPKVSGLDLLDNNIFHNPYISEMYIFYEP